MTDKIPVPPVGAAPATAEHFQIATQKPAVKFLSRGVQPPSQVYVAISDALQVSAASTIDGETVTVSYRLLRVDSELVLGQFTVATGIVRTIGTHIEPLAEGFLLSVSCSAKLANTRGQTFARVFLGSPPLGAGQAAQVLFADYITTQISPAHPGGRVLAPTEGPGNVNGIRGQNPLAGFEVVFSSPSNTRWRLISLTATLTTSATAGNRIAGLDLFASGFAFLFGGANQAQGPSAGFIYTWGGGLQFLFDGISAVQEPSLNNLILPASSVIETATRNLKVDDQWTNATVLVEEWLDNV